MKTKSNFTMIEMVVVFVVIIVVFNLLILPYFSTQLSTPPFSYCQGNLADLGKQFISYSLDEGFFPCTVVYFDNYKTIDMKFKDKKRSTLEVYNTYRENDNADIDPKRFFCPSSSCRQPKKKNSRLKKSNVSYHYVNGDVSTRIMKGYKGLIRDCNEGHEDATYGAVLTAHGAVLKVNKIGRRIKGNNYRVNWYRNNKEFVNYKDFDNFMNDVSDKKRDEVD